MTSSLPIYETLLNELPDEDLTQVEKTQFMTLIKNIDDYGSEVMYALIRMFQLEHCEDKTTFKIPYGGKFIKNDIKFDLLELPNKLKQILYKFLLMHTKSQNEEITKIKKIRKIKSSNKIKINEDDDEDCDREEGKENDDNDEFNDLKITTLSF
jgi:hypothetical protein